MRTAWHPARGGHVGFGWCVTARSGSRPEFRSPLVEAVSVGSGGDGEGGMVTAHELGIAAGEVVPQLLAVGVGGARGGTGSAGEQFIAAGHEAGVAMTRARGDGLGEPLIEREWRQRGAERRSVEVPGRVPLVGGDHPMVGGHEVVARDRLQHLAQVDDDRVAVGGNVDPLAILVLDLKSCNAVLPQQREESGVVMGVDARLTGGRGWVVDELTSDMQRSPNIWCR